MLEPLAAAYRIGDVSVGDLERLTDDALAEKGSRRATFGEAQRARDCFHILYGRHSRALLSFVSARVQQSQQDDVYQAVWLKVWEKLPGYQQGHFRAWLFQIARNYMIDQGRRKAAKPLPAGEMVPDRLCLAPDHALLDGERKAVLKSCLAELTDRERSVITALLSGIGYADLCTQLQMDSNAAYKASHSARNKLAACVQRKLD